MKFPSLKKKVKTGYLYMCLDKLGNKESIRTVFFFQIRFLFIYLFFQKKALITE